MSWYVYTLADPRTGVVRYVGQSSNPLNRLISHCSAVAAGNVRRWVRELGCEPTIAIVSEHASEAESQIAERAEMIRRQEAGEDLLNVRTKCGRHSARTRRFSGMGQRIRAARVALGLSQERLVKLCGVMRSNLCELESGARHGVTADVAVRYARALGVSVEWLVTGEEREASLQKRAS